MHLHWYIKKKKKCRFPFTKIFSYTTVFNIDNKYISVCVCIYNADCVYICIWMCLCGLPFLWTWQKIKKLMFWFFLFFIFIFLKEVTSLCKRLVQPEVKPIMYSTLSCFKPIWLSSVGRNVVLITKAKWFIEEDQTQKNNLSITTTFMNVSWWARANVEFYSE